jgi:hypothetical protein
MANCPERRKTYKKKSMLSQTANIPKSLQRCVGEEKTRPRVLVRFGRYPYRFAFEEDLVGGMKLAPPPNR